MVRFDELCSGVMNMNKYLPFYTKGVIAGYCKQLGINTPF